MRGTAGEARRRVRYPVAALVVYVALGVALGMICWALFLHGTDGGGARGMAPGGSPTPTHLQGSPSGGTKR